MSKSVGKELLDQYFYQETCVENKKEEMDIILKSLDSSRHSESNIIKNISKTCSCFTSSL